MNLHQHSKSAIGYAESKEWNKGMNMFHFSRKLAYVRKIKRIKKWREQNGKCYYCRIALRCDEATYDHIIPQSKGGSEHYDNFVVACDKCNKKRGTIDFGIFCNIVTSVEDLNEFVKEMNKPKVKILSVKKKKLQDLHNDIFIINKRIKKVKSINGLLIKELSQIDKKSIPLTEKNYKKNKMRKIIKYCKRLVDSYKKSRNSIEKEMKEMKKK